MGKESKIHTLLSPLKMSQNNVCIASPPQCLLKQNVAKTQDGEQMSKSTH